MSRIYLALLIGGLTLPAQAAIYKCVNADGDILFTDNKRSGACKLVVPGAGIATSVESPRRRASSSPSPSDFPRVDRQTQNRRDDVRRSLLLEERGNEEKALATTRASLASTKALGAEERTRLVESQRLHEKNIEMLDKELARIR
jgi:hypothetical protein